MKKIGGFSLIEVVVFMGILSVLIGASIFIGFKEYGTYIVDSEKEYLADTILENQARSLISDINQNKNVIKK